MNQRSFTRLILFCGLLMFPALPDLARAHAMPRSMVWLDLNSRGVHAELRLPIDRLEIGFGQPLMSDPRATVAQNREALRAYVAQHIWATGPDGRRWKTVVRDLSVVPETPAHELMVQVDLEAPEGVSPRRFTLHYDVIQHQIITHVALVSLRRDWDAGVLTGAPEMLGAMGYAHETLEVNRPAGSIWRGFASMVRLGTHHIAEGTDHLLFLLVLLLPAGLIARDGRWREYAGMRRSVRQLAFIVTAFTIGHSITLAVGALGWFRAPAELVEVLIAISILLSAIHAMRPLFPGREAFVAMAFGLVHGLAFATILAELGLTGSHLAFSILGFNLGIELMQLVVVIITVPWLLLLIKTGAYSAFRIGGATVAAFASVGWIGNRAFGFRNPLEPAIEWAASQSLWIVALLAAFALGMTIFARRPYAAGNVAASLSPTR